jgi:hypothetical protein
VTITDPLKENAWMRGMQRDSRTGIEWKAVRSAQVRRRRINTHGTTD